MFTLVEGQVDTRSAFVESSAEATFAPNSSVHFVMDFVSNFRLTHFGVKAQSGAFPYTVRLFSKTVVGFASLIAEFSSDGDAAVNISNLNLQAVSPTGKLYVELTHNQAGNEAFDLVAHADVLRAIPAV